MWSNSFLSSADGWNASFSSCWREILQVHNAAFNTLEGFSDWGALLQRATPSSSFTAKSSNMLYQSCRSQASCSVCVLGQSLWHLCISWEHSCCCCDSNSSELSEFPAKWEQILYLWKMCYNYLVCNKKQVDRAENSEEKFFLHHWLWQNRI